MKELFYLAVFVNLAGAIYSFWHLRREKARLNRERQELFAQCNTVDKIGLEYRAAYKSWQRQQAAELSTLRAMVGPESIEFSEEGGIHWRIAVSRN